MARHWSKGTFERRVVKFRSGVRLNGDRILGMNDDFILTKTSQNILRTFSRRDLTPGKVSWINEYCCAGRWLSGFQAIQMNGRISCARIFQNFIVCSVSDRISVFDVQDSSKVRLVNNFIGIFDSNLRVYRSVNCRYLKVGPSSNFTWILEIV